MPVLSQVWLMPRHAGMKPLKKVIILGGGYAGVNAALRLRLRNKDVEITLVNDRSDFIERIRNHELAAGRSARQLPLSDVLGEDIRFVLGRIQKLDIVTRQVLIDGKTCAYDMLIYALGSGALSRNAQHLHTINSREGAERFHADLLSRKDHGVTILGSGLTGIELATELRERFPDRKITLMDCRQPGSHLGIKAQNYLNSTLSDMRIGFEILTVDPLTNSGFVSDTEKEMNLVVNCMGFQSPDLARKSGLRCDDKNRVFANSHLQAEGHPEILVAGDAAVYGFGLQQITYAGCATAMPMGTYAGETAARILAGENPTEFRYGFTFQCISLGRKKGIIQFLDKRTGAATGAVLTGKTAAAFKELICRLTVLLPKLERKTRFPFYTWRKTRIMKRIGSLASKAA